MAVDEDIGGFEVAMDDEVGVGVLDGVGDLEEKTDPGWGGEGGGEPGEGEPVDELEDEVGMGLVVKAGIEEAGDVGVVEPGEEAFFGGEAAAGLRGGEWGVEEFDGGAHVGLAVGALGEPDDAHAAAAKLAEEEPGAEAGAWSQRRSGMFEEAVGAGLSGEEFAGLEKEIGVGG